MKYEVKIGDINLFKDLGLVITSKPIINLPSPRLSYIEVPGVHGALEIRDNDEVIYSNREGSLEFMISDIKKFYDNYQIFIDRIHGVKTTLIVDSKYFYYGRFRIDGLNADRNYSYLNISYILDPYKYLQEDIKTLGIKTLKKISLDIKVSMTLNEKTSMYIKPNFKISNSSNLKVLFNNKEYKLYDGDNIIPIIKGKNKLSLTFSGIGEIEISYKRGDI